MSDDELSEKFRQCAAWGGLDDRALRKRSSPCCGKSRAVRDVSELTRLLRRV
jgi:hypothetical protein